MTTFINITTNSVIAQERYWSFHRPVIELSGHMNFTSPFESSDSCNTCNGACCDYCEKVVTAGHFEFSVNSNELFQWMLEANVPENVATEIAFGGRGHSYDGYYLEWPTEETLAEEFSEFYNTLTSPDGEVMDVIESFRGQFDTFHGLREAVFAHFGLGKYCLSGHVYNQMEMYWHSCDYDHKKACTFSDDHNVDTELTADAELTVPEEVNEMNNHKYPAIGQLEQERIINSAKDGLDFNTNNTTVLEEEADYMCTLKYDHGVEIFMFHNPNAGCNSGEYHTLYVNGVVLDACRCGNGCHHTAAINRLEDEEYVLFLLGELEFDPREESAVEREYLDAKEHLKKRGINPDEVKYFTHSTEPTGLGPIYKFVVRAFMSPARLREENKKLLSTLVEQKKDLSDFRDADIIETLETYNLDTAIDIMDTLTDMGCISVHDLFREPRLIEGMEV